MTKTTSRIKFFTLIALLYFETKKIYDFINAQTLLQIQAAC